MTVKTHLSLEINVEHLKYCWSVKYGRKVIFITSAGKYSVNCYLPFGKWWLADQRMTG